jgi:hypothetical protein
METRKYDLEDRFVDYTCRMIDVVEELPNSRAGNYIAGQLVRVIRQHLIMEKHRLRNQQKTLSIKWELS